MKRKSFCIASVSFLFSLCSLANFSNVKKTSVEVEAKLSSIPQSVKDQVEELQAPAKTKYTGNYYDGITATRGKELRDALHEKIKNPSVTDYGGLWTLFYTSDRRPDGTVWDTYGDFPYEPGKDQAGNTGAEGTNYNREHSVPKSWFGEAKPMYSDAFHLMPTDTKVNSMRSNNAFGEVDNATYTYTFGQKGSNYVSGVSKLGSSKSPGISGTVFEPADCYKGDFARNYFYFVTAYYDKSITKADGAKMFSSSNNNVDKLYGLTQGARDLFVKWHKQDPVSEKEVIRCEAVFNCQKNRNPFIDHPEMVDAIWGDGEYHGGGGTTAKTLTGLTTTGTPIKTIYVVGETFNQTGVKVTATFSDGSTKDVTNEVTWSKGKFTSAGSETVTGTYTFENVTETVQVTVTVNNPPPPTKTLESVETSGECKTEYKVGETFDSTGLTVTAKFSDGSSENVTNQVSWDAYTGKAGEGTAIGTYSYGSAYREIYIDITIIEEIIDDDDDDPPVIDDDDDDDPPAPDNNDDDKPNSIIGMLPGLGCLGSVTSTSIVIFITAILGICLVCLCKKNKDIKN